MEQCTPHDLWEKAKQQLRNDIGEREWKAFTMQSAQGGYISIPETIKSLKAAGSQASAKYAKHKVKTSSGKELFEYNIGRILTRLDMMFQMVDSTMSYAPEMASVVWTAFRMLFNCFLIHKEACEFLSGAVDSISYAIFICEVCAKRYLAKASGGELVAGVVERIPGVYASVLQFSYETKKLVSANPARRLMDLMFGKLKDLQGYVGTATARLDELEKRVEISFKETVEEFIKGMGEDVKMVTDLMPEMAQGIQRLEGINQRIEDTSTRIEEGVKTLVASQGKSKEESDRDKLVKDHENMLKWLKPGAWLLDSSQLEAQHRDNFESIAAGSCDWIFDENDYKAWLGKENRRIMWLSGEAGFGKSFMSSAVIHAVSSVDRQQSSEGFRPLVIYFFCRSGSDASQKSERIMLHLLMQLFNHSSPDRLSERPKGDIRQIEQKTIQKCIEVMNSAKQRLKDAETSQESDHTARGLGISGIQKVFRDLTQALERNIIVVLDGLDECSDWSERNLLDTLMDLAEGDDSIRLMVTSRPEPSIVTAFSAKPSHSLIHIELDRERNGPGIASYVDEELRSVKHLKESQRHKARDVIMKKSAGMFRYATAVVETLKSPISAAAFSRIMQNLPLGMNNLYRKKMKSLDSEYRDWLLIALRWLVCGEGLISAEPIADEIQGTYCLDDLKQDEEYCESNSGDDAHQGRSGDDQQDTAEETGGSFYPIVINALSQHAREFLKLDSRDTIAMAHGSVRDWIISDAQEVEPLLGAEMQLCPSCKDRQRHEPTFEAAPKWGHLIMARNIMRTLNNREFQNKYGLLGEENIGPQPLDLPLFNTDVHPTEGNKGSPSQEIPTVVVDASEITEDVNNHGVEEKPDDISTGARIESTGQSSETSTKDEICEHVKTQVRAEGGVRSAADEEGDNIEGSISTETQDFANLESLALEKASSEHTNKQEGHVAHASLAPSDAAAAAPVSSEGGPMRDDATDAGTEEGGEYQYDNIEDPTKHLRYEITHWHYHVREAEANWSDEERQAHPYAAELFDELYEQLDIFMQEGALPFVQWQKQLRPDIFAVYEKEADSELLVEGPVHVAARYDLVGMLRRYIAAGTADLHRQNFFGNAPLHIASCSDTGYYVGSHAVLNLLLEAPDPPINLQNHRYEQTPLMLAMDGLMPEDFVRTLLEAGARPELPDNSGYTPLHWAADRRSLPLCRLLLEGREDVVNVNAQDHKGDTPLHWLLEWYNSSYEVAEYLLDKGADVRAEDLDSQQPLYKACKTSNIAIARLLVTRGADIDDPETIFGWTALHAAVAEQSLDLVKLLVDEGGATILVRDQKLRTPIAQAAELGNDAILEFLLKSQKERAMEKSSPNQSSDGAKEGKESKDVKWGGGMEEPKSADDGDDKNFLLYLDINSQSPLHRAAAKGLESCVRLLLDYSGDAKLLCSWRNKRGATPLHSAAHRGHANVVKMLADRMDTADIAALDNYGRTPLQFAVDGWKTSSDAGNANWSDIITTLWHKSPPLPQSERLELFGRAIEKGIGDVCRLFLDLVHVEDENGCTPLLLAVQEGRQNIISLLSHGSPSRWDGVDKISCLNVSEDGLELSGTAAAPASKDDVGDSWKMQSVRADSPIAAGQDHYYYEVTVVECERNYFTSYVSWVAIGFCSKYASLDDVFPGWSECKFPSWGYHSDDGCIFNQATHSMLNYPEDMRYSETYGQGDIIGAGVDFANRVMFFTKNGTRLKDAWVGDSIKGRLFPVVGMTSKGVRVRANFGSVPFSYQWERDEKVRT